jgi:hypothetical protein
MENKRGSEPGRVDYAVGIPIRQGISWYNNDSASIFPYVRVVGAFEGVAPSFEEALVIVEDVSGSEDGWSEITFEQNVSSETGYFYVIFQYPPNMAATGRGEGPGIGFSSSAENSCVFLSGDGEIWTKLINCERMLVEPIFEPEGDKGGALVLPSPKSGGKPEEVEQSDEIPVVVDRTELSPPFPNPFNPMTTIPFAIKDPVAVNIKIYDVRGRMVKHFDLGTVDMGFHEVIWRGRNDSGRNQSSGLYFAKMVAGGYSSVQRIMLVR